jgi:predicted phage tail protein
MRLKKIKVYGKLRQFLGKSYFTAAVKSPQQAMSFLIANFEGVQKHMNDQIYKVKMGGRVITEEYLSMSGQGDIQIIPIATGSLPVIIGAGLIGGAGAVGAAVGGVIGGALVTSLVTTALTTVGTSMLIGGVTDLLSPQNPVPDVSSVSDIDPAIRGSYSFSGIQNVSSSGVPIPIIYGLVFSGSIIISSGTDSTQVVKSIT